MPKSSQPNVAALMVGEWVGGFDNVRPLDDAECAGYTGRVIERGWELDFASDPEIGLSVRILLPKSFPYARPLVAVSADHFLRWPHIEEDGVVCALPLSATIDPYSPLVLTQYILNQALLAIKQGMLGLNIDDFRDEFYSYWNRLCSPDSVRVISTITDLGSSCTVSAWYGKRMIVIGDSKDTVDTWMNHRFGHSAEKRLYETASLINIPQALVPDEYPRRMSDVEKVIPQLDAKTRAVLLDQLTSEKARGLVIFNAPTTNGPALAAIRCSPPLRKNIYGHKTNVLQNGFRSGRVPASLRLTRYLRHAPAPKTMKVERADAKWIHGRETDSRAQTLSSKRVALIGVGSIGSFVAELLAASGVGDLTLIDEDRLRFANASRHVLGVDSKGAYKSAAVAELLQKRFPHHTFTGIVADGQSFLEDAKAKTTPLTSSSAWQETGNLIAF